MKLLRPIFNVLIIGALIVVVDGSTLAGGAEKIPQNPLANTEWRLSTFESSGTSTPVIQGTTISLKFGAEGRVSGNSGCNNYAGDYRVEGDTISFTRLLSTKRACINQGANEQETRYLSGLESAGRFQLRDDQLIIHYGDGKNTLNFVNASAAPADSGGVDDPLLVVSSFYDAVNARDYKRAYQLWEKAPQNFDDFVRGYSDTATVKVLADPKPAIEGAAGSVYAEIPTILLVRRRDGSDRVFAGCYVARKSNVEDKGWRIYRAKFSPISAIPNISTQLNQACKN